MTCVGETIHTGTANQSMKTSVPPTIAGRTPVSGVTTLLSERFVPLISTIVPGAMVAAVTADKYPPDVVAVMSPTFEVFAASEMASNGRFAVFELKYTTPETG